VVTVTKHPAGWLLNYRVQEEQLTVWFYFRSRNQATCVPAAVAVLGFISETGIRFACVLAAFLFLVCITEDAGTMSAVDPVFFPSEV